mgnify:CR=1 FL=1
MRTSMLITATFTALALTLGGCASNLSGDSYSRDEARKVQTVRMGGTTTCALLYGKRRSPCAVTCLVSWCRYTRDRTRRGVWCLSLTVSAWVNGWQSITT